MRRGLAIGALSLLLLAATACGGDDDSASDDDNAPSADQATELLGPEDAATGDPVKIGLVSDGATQAFDNTDELRAGKAAVEYWNAHKAGVAGRPLELVTCETGGDPAGATDCGNKMVEEDVVAVALSQSAVADSLWEPLHQAGIPTLFLQTNGDAQLTDDTNSFVMANPMSTLFGVPIAAAEAADAKKVTFVTVDVPVALTAFESGDADTILGNAGLDFDVVPIAIGTADLTSQMQQVVSDGADVVYVIGNDAFCIAAFQGLTAVGFDGTIGAVSQCITDATREAVPGDQLEGIQITATMALGDNEDPAYQLYQAVMSKYGDDVEDVDNATAMGGYVVTASLATALAGVDGDITADTATEAIKSMDEADYPGADGITFQCGGKTFPPQPAVCTNGSLRATLDDTGNPASYEPVDSTDILNGL